MATQNDVTSHKHGEMDITDHQKTFSSFMKLATWVAVISILVLIFMALANG